MNASTLFFAGFMVMAAAYFSIQIYEGDMFAPDEEERDVLDWVVSAGFFISGILTSQLAKRFLDNRYIVTRRRDTLDREEYR